MVKDTRHSEQPPVTLAPHVRTMVYTRFQAFRRAGSKVRISLRWSLLPGVFEREERMPGVPEHPLNLHGIGEPVFAPFVAELEDGPDGVPVDEGVRHLDDVAYRLRLHTINH